MGRVEKFVVVVALLVAAAAFVDAKDKIDKVVELSGKRYDDFKKAMATKLKDQKINTDKAYVKGDDSQKPAGASAAVVKEGIANIKGTLAANFKGLNFSIYPVLASVSDFPTDSELKAAEEKAKATPLTKWDDYDKVDESKLLYNVEIAFPAGTLSDKDPVPPAKSGEPKKFSLKSLVTEITAAAKKSGTAKGKKDEYDILLVVDDSGKSRGKRKQSARGLSGLTRTELEKKKHRKRSRAQAKWYIDTLGTAANTPLIGGASANILGDGSIGTIGGILVNKATNELYAMSNHHVFDTNDATACHASEYLYGKANPGCAVAVAGAGMAGPCCKTLGTVKAGGDQNDPLKDVATASILPTIDAKCEVRDAQAGSVRVKDIHRAADDGQHDKALGHRVRVAGARTHLDDNQVGAVDGADFHFKLYGLGFPTFADGLRTDIVGGVDWFAPPAGRARYVPNNEPKFWEDMLLGGRGVLFNIVDEPEFDADRNAAVQYQADPDKSVRNAWKDHGELDDAVKDAAIIFNALYDNPHRRLVTFASAAGDSGSWYMVGTSVLALHSSGWWERIACTGAPGQYKIVATRANFPALTADRGDWCGYRKIASAVSIKKALEVLNAAIKVRSDAGQIPAMTLDVCTIDRPMAVKVTKNAVSKIIPADATTSVGQFKDKVALAFNVQKNTLNLVRTAGNVALNDDVKILAKEIPNVPFEVTA